MAGENVFLPPSKFGAPPDDDTAVLLSS